MQLDQLDHLVLTVRDVEATCAFYQRVLGMQPVVFGSGRRALRFGSQKINLHPTGGAIVPRAARPTPGSAELCFLTRAPLEGIIEHLRAEGVAIVEGPVAREGALGRLTSVYFRDPDGNLLEVARYDQESDQPPPRRAG